jgi:uncharacterized protein with PIN domain
MSTAASTRAAELEQEAGEHAGELQRRAASDSRRVLECIDALERVTAEAVEALRKEMDALQAEIARCTSRAAPAEPAPDEMEPAQVVEAPPHPEETAEPAPTETHAQPEEASELGAAEADLVSEAQEDNAQEEERAAEEEPEEPEEPEAIRPVEPEAVEAEDETAEAPVAEPTTPGPARRRRRRLFPRFTSRRRGRPFIDTAGECAVCRRSLHAESEEKLRESGWQVRGATGLCPDCQEAGWDLREDGTVPSQSD